MTENFSYIAKVAVALLKPVYNSESSLTLSAVAYFDKTVARTRKKQSQTTKENDIQHNYFFRVNCKSPMSGLPLVEMTPICLANRHITLVVWLTLFLIMNQSVVWYN